MEKFPSIVGVKDHLKTCEKAVSHKCLACGKVFTGWMVAQNHVKHWHVGYSVTAFLYSGKFGIIGSLSSDLFERRTCIRSELFAHLSCDFEQTFGQIVSVRTLSHTNLLASRHIKREKKLTSG